MSQDPGCKGTNEAENIVVDGGDLANVFVYVKDGLGNRTFDVPKDPVVLDQKGCQYHPHVLGVMAGQTVADQERRSDHAQHPSHAKRQPRVERIAAAIFSARSKRISPAKRSCCR